MTVQASPDGLARCLVDLDCVAGAHGVGPDEATCAFDSVGCFGEEGPEQVEQVGVGGVQLQLNGDGLLGGTGAQGFRFAA